MEGPWTKSTDLSCSSNKSPNFTHVTDTETSIFTHDPHVPDYLLGFQWWKAGGQTDQSFHRFDLISLKCLYFLNLSGPKIS